MRVLVFDPGDHTGWVFRDTLTKYITGGTVVKDFRELMGLYEEFQPQVVVYESFQLYAGAAQHLVHNEFYVCQVIGAIVLLNMQYNVGKVIVQAPYVKKYSGGLDDRWGNMIKAGGVTEHVKDAYLHLKYFERNSMKKIKE